MKKVFRALIVTSLAIFLIGLLSGVASAQWTGNYSYSGVWLKGGVAGGGSGYAPGGYNRSGLAWGSAGWARNSRYGFGVGAGLGPMGHGSLGIKIPMVGPFNVQW